MSRYTYNASLVTQSIGELYNAEDSIKNTNIDIEKGITTITGARGAENISVDFSVIRNYQSQVTESIDLIVEALRSKAQEIEEYQGAPWYKKLFATIGMGALKLVEGLATFVENIGDGLVSIVGFVGGIFSSEFKDSVGEFVKTDWVGDTAATWYEEGWLQDVNKYSIMSHESTAANVLKGVGVAAGYVILSVATAGAGTAVSLGVSTAAAGVGGIGSGTQSGLQAGQTFNQAFGEGIKQGAVAAGTTLIVGGLANKLGSLAKGAGTLDDAGAVLATSGDDVTRAIATSGDDLLNVGDDVLRVAGGTTDDIIRTGTSFADEIAASLDEGTEIVGKAVAQNGDELVVVRNAAGQTGAFVKSGDQVGKLMTNNIDEIAAAVSKSGGVYDDIGGLLTNIDDVTNVGTQAVAAVDDVANIGTQALSAVDDVASTGTQALSAVDDIANAGSNGLSVVDDAINLADDAAGVVDDAANATKTGIGQRIIDKADEVITNFGTNTKVGQALSNVAAKAGPTVTNAVAAVAGPAAAGTLADPIETSMYREAVNMSENPTPGQTLYQETRLTQDQLPTHAEPAPTTITPPSGGEVPSDGTPSGTPNTQTPTDVTPNNTTPSSGGYPSGGSITVPDVGISDYPSTPDAGEQPTITVPNTEIPNYPSTPDDIIGGNDDILPGPGTDPSNPSNPQNPSISGTTPNIPGISDENSNLSGEQTSGILDSLGDMTGSLNEIVGNNKTNIPTSSAPILAGDGTIKKSMIPLGAGLGAAALAGIGTKAYLDKKNKSSEEDDENIDAEEWEEDADSVEIDYGLENNQESDYLSPTDEYAFQE